jgi:hypothetical protein
MSRRKPSQPAAARLPFVPPESTSSRGPGYLYVLPCAYEDLLKLGFSRDPLARMQAIHPRWFEFFDLDRAFAVQTETAREALDLETRHARQLIDYSAPAPLLASVQAGGGTEWYRGAYDVLCSAADALQAHGHDAHRPLRPWLRTRLENMADLLFAWTQLLSPDELQARGAQARSTATQRHAGDVLDAYVALGIDLRPWLAPAVFDWHSESLRDATRL